MTSSSWNIIHVTGPLWGESTGHRWITFTKASDAELCCFLWSANEQTFKQTIEMPVICDPYRSHYDVTVMNYFLMFHSRNFSWNYRLQGNRHLENVLEVFVCSLQGNRQMSLKYLSATKPPCWSWSRCWLFLQTIISRTFPGTKHLNFEIIPVWYRSNYIDQVINVFGSIRRQDSIKTNTETVLRRIHSRKVSEWWSTMAALLVFCNGSPWARCIFCTVGQ